MDGSKHEDFPVLQSAEPLERSVWVRTAVAMLVLGALTLGVSQFAGVEAWWIHGVWCLIAFAVLAPVLVRTLLSGVDVVLIDHRVMFTAAFVLYYVVGAAVLTFGSEASKAWLQGFYAVKANSAVWVDAMNSIGLGVTLLVATNASVSFVGKQAEKLARAASRIPTPLAVPLLLAIGVAASYSVLAFDLGFGAELVSGSVRAAASFTLVAIFVGVAYRGRFSGWLMAVAILMAGFEVFAGLILFSKMRVLLPLAALAVGLALRYRSRTVLVVGALVLAIVYVNLGGLVNYGRIASASTGEKVLSVAERWAIIGAGTAGGAKEGRSAEYSPWGRLCYVPAQSAARVFYDAGRGGNDIRLLPWVFVPRAIVPSKPIITNGSRDFNRKMTGHYDSSNSPGVFLDGYYNAGWLGFLFFSAVIGWILAQTSKMARVVVTRNAMLLLPFALLGVFIAFRIDGHFLYDYVGAFAFLVYLLVFGMVVSFAMSRWGSKKHA